MVGVDAGVQHRRHDAGTRRTEQGVRVVRPDDRERLRQFGMDLTVQRDANDVGLRCQCLNAGDSGRAGEGGNGSVPMLDRELSRRHRACNASSSRCDCRLLRADIVRDAPSLRCTRLCT